MKLRGEAAQNFFCPPNPKTVPTALIYMSIYNFLISKWRAVAYVMMSCYRVVVILERRASKPSLYIDGGLVDKLHKTRIPIPIHSAWQNTLH